MNDTAIRDMVISHDKVLDALSENIKTLAHTTGSTNNKLDKVVDELGKQNVLIERMNNMDREVGESFKRVHARLFKIEEAKDGDGCNAARLNKKAISEVENTSKSNTDEIKDIKDELPKKVDYSIVRWVIAIVILYTVTFSTYIVQSLQSLDKGNAAVVTHVKTMDKNLDKLNARVRSVELIQAAGMKK